MGIFKKIGQGVKKGVQRIKGEVKYRQEKKTNRIIAKAEQRIAERGGTPLTGGTGAIGLPYSGDILQAKMEDQSEDYSPVGGSGGFQDVLKKYGKWLAVAAVVLVGFFFLKRKRR